MKRLVLKRLSCAIIILGLCSLNVAAANRSVSAPNSAVAFARLADQLEKQARQQLERDNPASAKLDRPFRVGIGQFLLNGDNGAQTAFSNVVRDGLEKALAARNSFSVITRQRIWEIQRAGEFQKETVAVNRIDGLVRGSYYPAGSDKIKIYAEIVWLEGGGIVKAEAELSRGEFPDGDFWKDDVHSPLARDIRLHLFLASFEPEVIKENPDRVQYFKSNGYVLGTFKVLENLLSERFDLRELSGSKDDPAFMRQFLDRQAKEANPLNQGNLLLSLTVGNIWVRKAVVTNNSKGKKTSQEQEMFRMEVFLTCYNLANPDPTQNTVVARGYVADASDPMTGLEQASKQAVAELLLRLRRKYPDLFNG